MQTHDIQAPPQFSCLEMRDLEGSFIDINDTEGTEDSHDDWIRLDANTSSSPIIRVWKQDTGKLLCVVHRNAISPDLCEIAVRNFTKVAQKGSTNRGIAAGSKHRNRSNASYEKGIHSNSAVIGYIDNTHYNRPCRLTAFSQKHFEEYEQGLPFIRAINQCFQELVPDAHACQLAEAQKTNFHIQNTAFSTVTVNYNFRTALHKDAGDFEHGFGNLVVCQEGVQGGWLLFPRYHVAVALNTCDFMAMDVHEWHCNSEIHLEHPAAYRLSFVCYLRNRMKDCNQTNHRLDFLGNTGKIDTESICREIFACVSEEMPPKTHIGKNAKGNQWWALQGHRFHIIYKNRRFVVHDTLKHTTIHNLLPALEYAKQMQEIQNFPDHHSQ